MKPRRIAKLCHISSGSAVVETAVLLPFLTLLALGTLDLGRFTYAQITVATASRNGAVYGSGSTTAAQDTAGIKSAAMAEMTGVNGANSSNPTVTSSYNSTDSSVRVTVSFKFSPIVSYPALPKTLTLNRTVEMRIMPSAKSDDDDDDDDD